MQESKDALMQGCKGVGQECGARLPGKCAGQDSKGVRQRCRTRVQKCKKVIAQGCNDAREPGKDAEQGYQTRVSDKGAGQACQARMLGKGIGQGCRTRVLDLGAGQGRPTRMPDKDAG